MINNCLIAFCVVVAAFSVGHVKGQRLSVPNMDQQCMNCICKASSNCNIAAQCNTVGESYFCGPFAISWAYWHDSGRPGDRGAPHDFETCLNNRTCAEESVRGYMRRYGRDCDADGVVTCYDLARIHTMGYGACADAAVEGLAYWNAFLDCYEGEEDQTLGEDSTMPEYDYGDDSIDSRDNET